MTLSIQHLISENKDACQRTLISRAWQWGRISRRVWGRDSASYFLESLALELDLLLRL